jgi:hypothetical protein
MNDWSELRDHCRQQAEAWLERVSIFDPDLRVRAYLASHRAELVERLTDQAELAALRAAAAPPEPNPISYAFGTDDVSGEVLSLAERKSRS